MTKKFECICGKMVYECDCPEVIDVCEEILDVFADNRLTLAQSAKAASLVFADICLQTAQPYDSFIAHINNYAKSLEASWPLG